MGAAWRLESIFHFTLDVADFERSLAFYTSLGFQLLRDNRDVVWPTDVARELRHASAPRAAARCSRSATEPHHTRLDLIEWLEPRRLARPPASRSRSACRASSRSARRTCAPPTRICARAASRSSARRASPIRAPASRPSSAAAIPDGHLVELIEYMPGVLGSRIAHLPRRT